MGASNTLPQLPKVPSIPTLTCADFDFSSGQPVDATDSDRRFVRLMRMEEIFLRTQAITTITFFQGVPDSDFIRGKVDSIVRQNPWLEGKIYSRDNFLNLEYQVNPKFGSFFIWRDAELDHRMSNEDMSNHVNHLVVKEGSQCLSSEELLFKATLVEISPTRFALIFSISHLIADGHTFYKLYAMMSKGVEAEALIVDRFPHFESLLEETLGETSIFTWLFTPGAMANFLTTTIFSPTLDTMVLDIDEEWISKQKKGFKATKDCPFVSTNDILTSWLFNVSTCDFGLMLVNFRNRYPELTDKHAGNYEGIISYRKPDFENPALIRLSLNNFRPAISQSMPGFFDTISANICTVSSWVGIQSEIEWDGCEEEYHMPFYDGRTIPFDLCYIFKPTKDTVSVLTFSRTFTRTMPSQPAIKKFR